MSYTVLVAFIQRRGFRVVWSDMVSRHLKLLSLVVQGVNSTFSSTNFKVEKNARRKVNPKKWVFDPGQVSSRGSRLS